MSIIQLLTISVFHDSFLLTNIRRLALFVRITKSGTKRSPKEYVQIAISYRDKETGKSRQKILCTLGRLDELLKTGAFDRFLKSASRLSEELHLIEGKEGAVRDALILGSILAIEKAFRDLGLDRKLKKIAETRRIRYDFVKAVKLMLLNRLIAPKSKLSIMEWLKELATRKEYEDLQLQHLYRSLDILADEAGNIKKHLYEERRQLELFRPSVDVVFYDLTTIYFESELEDELKKFGYSKDNKSDCVQVVLGVVLDGEGMPITYDIYPGNTFEGSTVIEMVKKLRQEYEVEKVIFVADRGLASEKLLRALEEMGCGYVVAARVKKLSEAVVEKITHNRGWQQIDDNLKVKELEVKGRRLVVYRDEELALYEKTKRQELLDWLKQQILSNPKRLIASRRYSGYLKVEGARIELNLEAIKKQERLDGIFGFWCSRDSIPKEEAYKIYKQLWQIEDAFRSMKSNLKIRPIYHWTPKRIRGHILMCYMAFCLYKWMEKKLKQAGLNITASAAIEKLSRVRSVTIETTKGPVKFRTEVKGETTELFRALGVKIPSVVLSVGAED